MARQSYAPGMVLHRVSLRRKTPLGSRGGLNLYGFADGDPVNFSDPFGLCPVCLIAWGAWELGSGVYDVYQAATTLSDPYASNMEKTATVGLAAAGISCQGAVIVLRERLLEMLMAAPPLRSSH